MAATRFWSRWWCCWWSKMDRSMKSRSLVPVYTRFFLRPTRVQLYEWYKRLSNASINWLEVRNGIAYPLEEILQSPLFATASCLEGRTLLSRASSSASSFFATWLPLLSVATREIALLRRLRRRHLLRLRCRYDVFIRRQRSSIISLRQCAQDDDTSQSNHDERAVRFYLTR